MVILLGQAWYTGEWEKLLHWLLIGALWKILSYAWRTPWHEFDQTSSWNSNSLCYIKLELIKSLIKLKKLSPKGEHQVPSLHLLDNQVVLSSYLACVSKTIRRFTWILSYLPIWCKSCYGVLQESIKLTNSLATLHN